MRRLLYNSLPLRLRLDQIVVNGREFLRGKQAYRSGNRLSRHFRQIFEHKRLKRVLGSNLAVLAVITSLLPVSTSTFGETVEANMVLSEELNIITERGVAYPLELIQVNQGYRLFHPGIDFEGITGDPVNPIMAGVIEAVQYSKYAYGNSIIIAHNERFSSLYAHLSKIQVGVGEKVDTRSVIGEVGSTGRSSGDHLHLEVRDNGYAINPYSVLPR